MRIVARNKPATRGTRSQTAREFDRAVAEFFMRMALDEAEKGVGRTSPNPAVGAVLVKNGHVLARGFHAKAGGPHAEIVALRQAGGRARGADLYTTLEPCNHHGRTPPCTEAILAAGIRRVFVGCLDANPRVSGRGVKRLRSGGLKVVSGVLNDQCAELNAPFFTFITRKRPFVTLKVASTADGRIAGESGDSRWVTGPAARARVHQLRGRVDAVLVGGGTVRMDDPQLTARPRGRPAARQPMRVVLSASLDLPPSAKVFAGRPGGALVLTASPDEAKAAALRKAGAQVVRLPAGPSGSLDLRAVLDELARRDVVHLLVEGGAGVFGGFLEAGLADEILLFVAPRVLGSGLSWATLSGRARIEDAIALEPWHVEQLGPDVLLTARPGR
jgi:diaminohydroxyphosphoribosylaminopyrimidine deaminase/5-amino-6-(5-phosphoribosylamino)uracil reductase